MLTITPYGAFCLSLCVTQWNRLIKGKYSPAFYEQKEYIKRHLLSDDTMLKNRAIAGIENIAQMLTKRSDEHSYKSWAYGFLEEIMRGQDDGNQSKRQELEGLARRDIGLHFEHMFKIGHFEQIPMPDLKYELPPKDLGISISDRDNAWNKVGAEIAKERL